MYPQAETAEGRLDSLDPDAFKYEIIARETAARSSGGEGRQNHRHCTSSEKLWCSSFLVHTLKSGPNKALRFKRSGSPGPRFSVWTPGRPYRVR